MKLFQPSFEKPGKGVKDNAPPKSLYVRFLGKFIEKFWYFSKMNILYMITLIPFFAVVMAMSVTACAKYFETVSDLQVDIFVLLCFGCYLTNFIVSVWGLGPISAGMTHIMSRFARGEHAWLWSDFKIAVKRNFKKAAVVFAADVLLMIFFYVALVTYSKHGMVYSLLRCCVYLLILIVSCMHLYIYPLMTETELSIKDILLNSVLFAFSGIAKNSVIIFIQLFIHVVFPVFLFEISGPYVLVSTGIFLLFEFFILQAFSAFLVNFAVCPEVCGKNSRLQM